MLHEMPVSTLEPNFNYEILGIVSFSFPGNFDKQIFGRKLNNEEWDKELILKLIEKAKTLGADGVYGVRYDITPSPGAMAIDRFFNMYGTAVKRIEAE